MKLYVARHGETMFNIENRVLDSTPGELTDKGVDQAKELAKHVQTLGLDRAYSSDLARTVATVKNTAELLPKLEIVYTKELRGRDFGLLEVNSELTSIGMVSGRYRQTQQSMDMEQKALIISLNVLQAS